MNILKNYSKKLTKEEKQKIYDKYKKFIYYEKYKKLT